MAMKKKNKKKNLDWQRMKGADALQARTNTNHMLPTR
jgi:hypothetical protein